MDRYQATESDRDAWLAHRMLQHDMDRRILVEEQEKGWPAALSRPRALNHQVAKTNYVAIFQRNEGALESTFGSMDTATHMPPWDEIAVYGT